MVDNVWVDEPDWLVKKRQLATDRGGHLPQFNQQEKWLSWQPKSGSAAGWLSNEGKYIAMPLSQAVESYSEMLQENLMEKALRWQDNQLFAAHLAHIDGGQFIYVPDNCHLRVPVNFAPQGTLTNPHNLIVVGANSKVTIEEQARFSSESAIFTGTEVLLGANAQVNYRWADQFRSPAVFAALHAYQAAGAHLDVAAAVTEAADVTMSLNDYLDGANSIWENQVLLRPDPAGTVNLMAKVDGAGAGSRARLCALQDESAGGQVNVQPLGPAFWEPLPVADHLVKKTATGFTDGDQPVDESAWHSYDDWLNRHI